MSKALFQFIFYQGMIFNIALLRTVIVIGIWIFKYFGRREERAIETLELLRSAEERDAKDH